MKVYIVKKKGYRVFDDKESAINVAKAWKARVYEQKVILNKRIWKFEHKRIKQIPQEKLSERITLTI